MERHAVAQLKGLDEVRPLDPPPSLTATLMTRLREEITSGRLPAGAQLPSESWLVRSFGVSRTVVREAVAALRAEGLVTTRRGLGAFVASARPRRDFPITPEELSSIEDVLAVLELRTAFEVEAAGLAAQRRTASDLERLQAAIEELDARIAETGDSVGADFAFHAAVASATGNAYFPRFLASLVTVLIPRARVRADLDDPKTRAAYLARIIAEHNAIAQAIAAGDRGRARRAMRRHLQGSRYRMLLREARIEARLPAPAS